MPYDKYKQVDWDFLNEEEFLHARGSIKLAFEEYVGF